MFFASVRVFLWRLNTFFIIPLSPQESLQKLKVERTFLNHLCQYRSTPWRDMALLKNKNCLSFLFKIQVWAASSNNPPPPFYSFVFVAKYFWLYCMKPLSDNGIAITWFIFLLLIFCKQKLTHFFNIYLEHDNCFKISYIIIFGHFCALVLLLETIFSI